MSTQKRLAEMLRVYQQALQLLRTQRIEEGTALIHDLLSSALINDPDLRHLKYSALLSLAEVSQHTGQFLPALKYYYAAIECNSAGSFMLLLKMYKLSELLHLTDISIVLLKKALKISPSLWRERVLDMLADAYQGAGRNEALRDLQHVRINKLRMEEILMEDWCVPARPAPAPPQPSQSHLPYLKIFIDPVTVGGKYGTREYLLTIAYILLKCKLPRNFHSRKFYNKDSPVWGQFIRRYHPILTSIHFVSQEGRQSCHEASSLINQLAVSLLKELHKGGKRKETKVQVTAKKPSKLNSVSLWEYYREGLTKAEFKRESLSCLQQWDSKLFQNIFGKIFAVVEQPENIDVRNNEKQVEDTPRKIQKPAREVEENKLLQHYGNVHEFVQSVYARGDRIGQKMLMKCVTKMIETTEGCMAEVEPKQLLEDLVDRLEYLVEKKYADLESYLHKNTKIREISIFIDKKYTLTLSYLRDCLNTPKAESVFHIAKLLLKKSCFMVILDSSKANSDIEFYRRVCSALNPKEDLEGEVDKFTKKMLKVKSQLEAAKQNERKMVSEGQVEAKQALNACSSIYDILSEYSGKKVVCEEGCKAYLQSLVELLIVFSSALEGKDEQRSNLKELNKIYERMQIKRLLTELLEKIESGKFRVSQVSLQLKNNILYHLIRLQLLGLQRLLRFSEQCLRLVFYLTNLVSRDMKPNQKNSLIPRFVGLYACMLSGLVRDKEDKEEVKALYIVKQKFFLNVFARNLAYIRHSHLFSVTNEKSMQESLAVCLESYFYDKEISFSVETYSEAQGYLFFLSHWHYDGFNCESIEMKPEVSRILGQVVPLYERSRKEYCHRVKQFKVEFNEMMKDGESTGLQQVVGGEEVCRCCEDYSKVLLIIAKYYQLIQNNRKNQYFLEFFLLNVHSERAQEAWEHLMRTHCQQFCATIDHKTYHNTHWGQCQKFLKLPLLNLALSNTAIPTYVRKEAYCWQFIFRLLRLKFNQANDMLQKMQSQDQSMIAYHSFQELLSIGIKGDLRVWYLKLMEVLIPFAKLNGFKTVTVNQIASDASELLKAMSLSPKSDVVGNLDLDVIISIYVILAEQLERVLDVILDEKASQESLRNALDSVYRFALKLPEKYKMKQFSEEDLFSQLEKYDEVRKETVVSDQDEEEDEGQEKDIIEVIEIEEMDDLERRDDGDEAMEDERSEDKMSQIVEKQFDEVRNRQGVKNIQLKKKRQSKSKAKVLSYFRIRGGVGHAEMMVIEMENIINRLTVIFTEQTKKFKTRRFSAQANLACARWSLKYGYPPTRVQDIFSSKNAFLLMDDCKKKNDMLANFYERSVVRYLSRANSILELIEVCLAHNCFIRVVTLLINLFKSSEPTREMRVLLVYGVCRLLQMVVSSEQQLEQKLQRKVVDLCNKVRKVGELHDKNVQEKRVEQLVGQYESRWSRQLKVKWLKMPKVKDRRKSVPQKQDIV